MITKSAYKYRIYPTPRQKNYIDGCIGSCWWFYRYVLHNYEDDYRTARRNHNNEVMVWYNRASAYHPNWFTTTNKPKITQEYYPRGGSLRHQGKGNLSTYKLLMSARESRPHLNDIPAIVLQDVLERVDSAFKKFWREGAGRPRYPKRSSYNSITWTSVNSIKLYEAEGLLKLSKVPGLIRVVYHRPIQGRIKRANVSRDGDGRYYVSLMCEYDSETPMPHGERVIGIDMNIKAIDANSRSFIALSNGEKVDIPRWYSQNEARVRKISQKISACEHGTKLCEKHHRSRNRIYRKMDNARSDWIHNLTRRLEREYDYVVIEDMDLTGFKRKRKDPESVPNVQLSADRGVRKAWSEAPFGEFKRQLAYKMGDRLIKVDPKNTSKRCNVCGVINNTLTLDEREWTCKACSTHHDRDTNAAINIRNLGLEVISCPQ